MDSSQSDFPSHNGKENRAAGMDDSIRELLSPLFRMRQVRLFVAHNAAIPAKKQLLTAKSEIDQLFESLLD